MRHYDVLMVTDCRLPGGTSASVAEEITAQAAGGYRTGLVHVDSSLVALPTSFEPRIQRCLEDGRAELVLGTQPVQADLVVLRHPTVAAEVGEQQPTVQTQQALLVANQAPGDVDGPVVHYDPGVVDTRVAEWLGVRPTWTPIGPLVRQNLQRLAPEVALTEDDWVNVIDVDRWHIARPGPLHRIPVIGRHSRNAAGKWPATAETLLAVYPDTDDLEVHVLGGADTPRALLGGRLPQNWVVHEFGAISPQRFLGGLDVYVYYHHPALVEAFGRTILEAMASGLPPVLPEHFRDLFGDACTYAPVSGAVTAVRELTADADRYRERSAAATAWVRDHSGHEVHQQRLGRLVQPSGGTAPATRAAHAAPAATDATTDGDADTDTDADRSAAQAATTSSRRRVLFVSSNGAGVGHLMRLMAIARRMPDDVEPIFLTLSQAAQVVDDLGLLVEYLPSRGYTRAPYGAWHEKFRSRLVELIDRYDVEAMIFDGTMPYWGFFDAGDDRPGVRLWWSRRAMWKEGTTNVVIDHFSDRFDLILEPGEFADNDRGITRQRRDEATVVAPITFLGADELLDRDTARKELGLDPDRPSVLVNLGAGNINDTASQLGMVIERLGREPELQVCVTRSIIASQERHLPDNVQSISVYPLARYLAAFDFAFAASGYNSYHELVLAGVPTAFVPNLETSVDDQGARSEFAERIGVGLDLREVTAETVDVAVRRLLDADLRQRMHERALARRPGDGAAEAAEVLARALDEVPGRRPTPRQLAERREAFEQTDATPPAGAPRATSVVSPQTATATPATEEADDETVAGAPATGPVPAPPETGHTHPEAPRDAAPATADASAAPDAPDAPATPATAAPAASAGSSAPGASTAPATAPASSPSTQVVPTSPRALAPVTSRKRPGGAKKLLAELRADPKRFAVRVANDQRVRSLGGKAFHALPAAARKKVRRRLTRWEVAAGKTAKGAGRPRSVRLPVQPGNLLPEHEHRGLLPIAIVLPTGLTPEQQARLVDVVGQMQLSLRTFTPLLVTSCIDFRPLRNLDYLFEYQPDADRYARVHVDQTWEEARRQRLHDIMHRYRITSVVTLPRPAGGTVEDVEPLAADLRLALGALQA
ncbi:hypothetical protein [Egicoccus sp. AB-alg2]|uniref:hypothetical protein n=1 Tax=Egicoccus sp. AB-alg2 TaxID=3242693 RepID=UPI00359E788A